MFIVRDIFRLRYGHARDAVALVKQAFDKGMMPQAKALRVLTDFTGDAYRLILEAGFDTLGEYEQSLAGELAGADWQQWYREFRQHVEGSHREILREVAL